MIETTMELDIFNHFQKDLEQLQTFENFMAVGERRQRVATQAICCVKRKSKKSFNPLFDIPDNQFKVKYRFTKDNMRKIIEMLRDDLDTDTTEPSTRSNQVPVDLQIMAAIRFWGHTEHPEITASAHGVSDRTMNKICRRVSSCLSAKASRYIRMPATLAEKERVTSAFQELGRMPQVIGAVGHHSVRLKRVDSPIQKGINTADTDLHIQVVADASLKIRDLDCKEHTLYEKDYACKMFTHSRIKERLEQNEFRGRFLLGGHELPTTPYLFTSILYPNSNAEENFNRSHAFTYASVTNCIHLWRKRFGILGSGLMGSPSTVKHTIVALAVLHNLAIEWNDRDIEHEENRLCNGHHTTEKIVPETVAALSRNHDIAARIEFIKNHF